MVKVINIDTKTRTIRVENAADGDIKTWRTTETGTHFPIKKGESTKEALDKFVEKKRPEAKKDKKKYIEFEEQGQTYRFPKPTKHEKLWDKAWENVKEYRRYSDPAPGGNATAEHTPEETEEEVRAEYKKLKTAERAKQAKEKQQAKPSKKGFKGDDVSYEQWTKRYDITPEQRMDEAFAVDDLEEEWGKAKKNLSYHGLSASTVEDIYDYVLNTKKYNADDIIEALQSSSHDKIDQLRVEAKKYQEKAAKQQPAKKETKSEDPRKNEAESSDNFHALWKKYVPDEGTADTLLGEMVRAAGRIRYRYYNDGDMYGYGYGKETVNNALSYLSKLAGGRDTEFKKELDRALYQATTAAAHYDEDEYKRQVDRIVDAFANANWDDIKELASIKNETDSLTEYPDDTSYDDDDEDEEW